MCIAVDERHLSRPARVGEGNLKSLTDPNGDTTRHGYDALDRLLHHAHVIQIRGDSYRLRQARQSGLIGGNTNG